MSKRDAVVKSAYELFAKEGFHNTTTAKISKNAGVATGTLFTFFKTKEELIDTIYLEAKEEILRKIQIAIDLEKSVYQNLKIVFRTWGKWALKEPIKFKFVIQYSNSAYITETTKEQVASNCSNFNSIYQRGIDEGLIKDLPIDFLSSIFGSCGVATINYLIENPDLKKDRFISEAFEIFWKGIKI